METKAFIITTVCTSFFPDIFGSVKPYGINETCGQVSISNADVSGTYTEATGSLELTFKKDAEHMDILIFKNGKVCEKDKKQYVSKDDTEVYQISDYGTGIYTVCTGRNGTLKIVGTIVHQ